MRRTNELPWQKRAGSIAFAVCTAATRGVLRVKMIVGLGNPGREYASTRHNLGFMVVDEIARRLGGGERKSRFRAELREVRDDGEKLVLIKPQTYMNLSGTSVREAAHWYKIPPSDLLVVVDDIDLPFGTLRMRPDGGSGGHNGLKSIIAELGTQEFPRFRIGIGRGQGHAVRQVLGRFNADEERALPELIAAAADCALDWARHGALATMNRCNRRPEPEPAASASPFA
jgi:PTH1 family peptidyl-tRNA hydrolase